MKLIKTGAGSLAALKRAASLQSTTPNNTETLLLLLDRSGSMGGPDPHFPTKLEGLRAAVAALVEAADPKASKIGVLSFSDEGRVDAPATTRYQFIREAMNNIRPCCSTSMYDTVQKANAIMCTSPDPIKRFIVMSDGWVYDSDAVLTFVKSSLRKDIIIDTVYFGEEEEVEGSGSWFMKELASLTGGIYVLARNAKELVQKFPQLEAGVRGLLTSEAKA